MRSTKKILKSAFKLTVYACVFKELTLFVISNVRSSKSIVLNTCLNGSGQVAFLVNSIWRLKMVCASFRTGTEEPDWKIKTFNFSIV